MSHDERSAKSFILTDERLSITIDAYRPHAFPRGVAGIRLWSIHVQPLVKVHMSQRNNSLHRRGTTPALTVLLFSFVGLVLTQASGVAQEKQIYSFTGHTDGLRPEAGLTVDKQGNLYGTATNGGNLATCDGIGCGAVFELVRTAGGKWRELTLYDFAGGQQDGAFPGSLLTFDSHGHLLGTTIYGGSGTCNTNGQYPNCGTVFELTRSPGGGWTETVIHSFQGYDGATPTSGLIADGIGNLYGTTQAGGVGSNSNCATDGCGTVFELTPNSNGSWSENVLYSFQGGSDGASPTGGLVRDGKGNLFGTTEVGGSTPCYFGLGCGTVFELQDTSSGWVKTTIYEFVGGTDGMDPTANLALDPAGRLYGTTVYGGGFVLLFGYGTVFRLSQDSEGTWSEAVLYRFTGLEDGGVPDGGVILDSAGRLYGSNTAGGTSIAGNGGGVIFGLAPSSSGTWSETTLHTFLGSPDGLFGMGQLTRDGSGNFYGVTWFGGAHTKNNCIDGCGTIFTFAP